MLNLFCYTLLTVSILLAGMAKAQLPDRVMEIPKSAADCQGAIKIVDAIGPLKNASGSGFYQEINNGYQEYPFLLPREFNPCWFRFNAEEDGMLEIVIKSVDPAENYNFALYNSPGPWFCKSFPSEFISSPVRANCSSADQGVTGLNASASDTIAGPEVSSSFCKSLKVSKGEAFYLLVDSDIRPQKGYAVEIKLLQVPNE